MVINLLIFKFGLRITKERQNRQIIPQDFGKEFEKVAFKRETYNQGGCNHFASTEPGVGFLRSTIRGITKNHFEILKLLKFFLSEVGIFSMHNHS